MKVIIPHIQRCLAGKNKTEVGPFATFGRTSARASRSEPCRFKSGLFEGPDCDALECPSDRNSTMSVCLFSASHVGSNPKKHSEQHVPQDTVCHVNSATLSSCAKLTKIIQDPFLQYPSAQNQFPTLPSPILPSQTENTRKHINKNTSRSTPHFFPNCSAHPASPVAARPTWFWAATASAQRCGRRCGRRGQTLSSSALRRLGGR